MPSTAWKFPGTVDGVVPGLNDWGTPNNVKLDDGLKATWLGSKLDSVAPGDAATLKTSNYNFGIPDTATVVGIELEMEGMIESGGGGANPDQYTYLTDIGTTTVVGTSKNDLWVLTTALTTFTFGSASDMWGNGSLTPAFVNTANFGVVWEIYDIVSAPSVSATYMKMRVHYTLPNEAAMMMGSSF